MRQMQSGGGKAMSFGKSRARLSSDQSEKVTFEDVAGIDEAKEELEEIIEFLNKNIDYFSISEIPPFGNLNDNQNSYSGLNLDRINCVFVSTPLETIVGGGFNFKLRYLILINKILMKKKTYTG